MKQHLFFAIAATVTATAVAAATQVVAPQGDARGGDVITIEVAPEELARCRETLAQVAAMPAVSDDGTPLPVSASAGLPQVACVVSEA